MSERGRAMAGIGARVVTGLALAALAVALVAWAPVWAVVLVVAGLAGLGVFEYSRMALPKGPRLEEAVCVLCAVCVPLAALKGPMALMAALMLAFMAAVCVTWLGRGELHLLMQHLLVRGWGLAYVCGLFSCLLLILTREHGRALLLFLIFCVVAADTGAYLAGHALGRHKMAPLLSPNKTWEGLAGGLTLAGLVGFSFAGLMLPDVRAWLGAGMGVALGVVSVGGDLLESSLKRAGGVKDSGFILPGHGGILDRLDGILGAGPLLLLARELWW